MKIPRQKKERKKERKNERKKEAYLRDAVEITSKDICINHEENFLE